MKNVRYVIVIQLDNEFGDCLGLQFSQEVISDVIGQFIEDVCFLLVIEQYPKLISSRWRRGADKVSDVTGRHVCQQRRDIRGGARAQRIGDASHCNACLCAHINHRVSLSIAREG